MDSPAVEAIVVNGPRRMFCIEGSRKRLDDGVEFDDDEETRALGKRLDERAPMIDAHLPDGSRLNAAIPPARTRGCAVTIRKFVLHTNSFKQLVALRTRYPASGRPLSLR